MLKKLTLADLDSLVPLFDLYCIFYHQQSDVGGVRSFLKDRLVNHDSVIFAFYQEGQAVAFTQLYPQYSSINMQKNWILNDLYVDAQFRRKGIGKQLIECALTFAKNAEAAYIQLETQKTNKEAKSLYEQLGFQEQGCDTEFVVFRKTILSINN